MSANEDDSRVALIDTSCYSADCTLSALVPQHAMKPYRLLATMELIRTLGLDRYCRTVIPPLIGIEQLLTYHAEDYISNLGLHNSRSWLWNTEVSKVTFSGDCPPVEGIVEYSLSTVSGSLMGAILLNSGKVDTAIHWGGGMHHAKCGECSGFCYVNDIVIAIIELLKCHERVLYVDLDMHHGDGVDEAFCQSSRVFTLSLHKFGESFFPGTGHPRDIGFGNGRHYTMNLAIWDGVDDFFYTVIFERALSSIVNRFKPDVVVVQCGADSLAGDRLGHFNLSSWGHGKCVEEVKKLGLPMLVLGGGGYTLRNVAKLWAYETSILCGNKVSLTTVIPIQRMPLSGWLFEDSPQLLVPQDEENRPLPGVNVQRSFKMVIEQIDKHSPNIGIL
ncbi:histone deacetylase 1 [Trypanosoma theileri]|uniref:Histone deacetylase n=1 Tax=Trypanosoma theileri TaxID=67003 RepID=A0A1X0NXU7_9TRYP|nr:histone deacetylase 1 [Trypanosoma theileri]ORC89431.1 histone deacetylase 1 [Trypanosoma theileri]